MRAGAIDAYITSGQSHSLGLVDHICPNCGNIKGVAMFSEYGGAFYEDEDQLTCSECQATMIDENDLNNLVIHFKRKKENTAKATKKIYKMTHKALKKLFAKVERERCSMEGLDAPEWLRIAWERLESIEEDKQERERDAYEKKMLGR